jgi:hypothetical protein
MVVSWHTATLRPSCGSARTTAVPDNYGRHPEPSKKYICPSWALKTKRLHLHIIGLPSIVDFAPSMQSAIRKTLRGA